MGATIIGPSAMPFPFPVSAPIVEIKRLWSDAWTVEPDLEPVRMDASTCGHKAGTLEVRRRYGRVKQPWETSFATRESWNLLDWWIRIRLAGAQGLETAWVGRIAAESRDLHGSDRGPAGVQSWIAHEPLFLLDRISVSISWWEVRIPNALFIVDGNRISEPYTTTVHELDWCPSWNSFDSRGVTVGNRNADKIGASHAFGGSSVWTRRQMVEYLLARFVDEGGVSGPSWTLGGQAEILEEISDTVKAGDTQSVADLLGRMIPRDMGLDFRISPTDTGFEVLVFALTATEASFGGKALPVNPNTVEVTVGESVDSIQTTLVRTREHRYGRIRVLGARVLVCCSLRAGDGSLVPKWTAALEALYKAGAGAAEDDPALHDKARAADVYRPVYQSYGAPSEWDFQSGKARPVVNGAGELQAGQSAPYQVKVRGTLSYLPLREGFDYAVDPPLDRNPEGHEPDLLPPMAWVYDDEDQRYVPAEEYRISVLAPKADWGVFLQASPNHVLALNHFTGDTETEPRFDYERLVATVALRSDERLALEYELPLEDEGDAHAPSDGSLDLVDESAELWYLAPGTVVGVDESGVLRSSGSTGRVLRNDASRLTLLMAGAIARYANERARAEIVAKGTIAWQGLLGAILTCLETGGDTHAVQGVITSVEWTFGENPLTTIKAGFAL